MKKKLPVILEKDDLDCFAHVNTIKQEQAYLKRWWPEYHFDHSEPMFEIDVVNNISYFYHKDVTRMPQAR